MPSLTYSVTPPPSLTGEVCLSVPDICSNVRTNVEPGSPPFSTWTLSTYPRGHQGLLQRAGSLTAQAWHL